MKKLFILSFLMILNGFLYAQHQNVQLPYSGSTYAPEEPSIYVNPYNTDKLIAGANINNIYISNDGGYTWDANVLVSNQNGVWGDPVTIVDTAENYLYFHLAYPPAGTGSWIDRIVCQKSTDGGLTWNDGSYMGLNGSKAQDKEWAVIDRTNNTIYVTWTQFDDYGSSNPNDKSSILFSKSTDEGETWSEALKINEVDGDCIDSDNTVEGAVPAVGPNGEVYVAWAGPEGIVFDRSLDGGETWLDEDIFVSDFPGGWDYAIPGINRCNGLPITVCDLSGGPNHGTIYINWSDQSNGANDTDVWIVKSIDGGDTWSDPIRVNDDPPGKQQFFTWMTVDQVTGYLWFVWYDRREYDDNNTDVFMALSEDGGETFINFKVSESSFLPNSGIFFGDYNCVSAHNNVVRPIWTRLVNNTLSIWTAIINPDAVIPVNVNEKDQVPFATMEPNYPNPFIESTAIAFKLKASGHVTLKVYDLFGREVASLINNEERLFGKYIETLDASDYNLSPGVYYFKLSGEGINLTRKMTLVK
ncbi:MAG: T9SS type A sorting domain-containing protein [Bacteroidetes bacterium]|nr:T9SS type A sorting domain-containing protein [Bacteroidota bacterium]